MKEIEIKFDGLKYSNTDYKFKNRKERSKYFDDALRSGVEVYKHELIKYMNEDLHIHFSFFWSFRIIAVLALGASWFPTSEISRWLMFGSGAVSAVMTAVYWFVYKNQMDRIAIAELLNDNMDDLLYEVRKDLMKENA
jgi:hypothetical protein